MVQEVNARIENVVSRIILLRNCARLSVLFLISRCLRFFFAFLQARLLVPNALMAPPRIAPPRPLSAMAGTEYPVDGP